ncbi:MAG: cellulase family glycosylhydrolase, partial [Calditrichaceae bacterium]|nr:cellulase family glycosylhydrolase [Calditrichaceae bacterium]
MGANKINAVKEHWLKVSGDKIINQKGEPVILRGFGLGGMLHMENFINGYPANEEAVREGMREILGEKKYNLFFDHFYENYFTEPDAEYIHNLGLNLIRIPIHYRQFEDDMHPRVIKEDAFKHLDRVIELCAKYQIYTIIDLHALPGFQNQHWHCDNPTHIAFFWQHKDFQDRAVHLWEIIANRYKDQSWLAGYDLINEPAEPAGEKVFLYYKRLRDAVLKIDPNHILFLEGNTYSTEFD